MTCCGKKERDRNSRKTQNDEKQRKYDNKEIYVQNSIKDNRRRDITTII